ncbi:Zinc finger MYM-type protein 1 [Merluccius polli]|uniref:Zinc finger MYM-type protein 1 n=1 Tax=Merluccius polli TaxID=89951 RepID=A0AA47N6W3_MERPO|nr:Zinc finger MYM-type protein 1 [Merluccius polli]
MTMLDVQIEEHFIDFIQVNDQTGKGLTEALLAKLETLGLDINDCRGQGYDNGANMKGLRQGVQAHVLHLNPRAYFMPCGCQSLNLVLGDMAKSCPKAMTFFGIAQRVYATFAGSPNRWEILRNRVPYLTLKPLSETRWECRVESVKAICYQTSDIVDALLEVGAESKDPKTKSEANSLANETQDFELILSTVIWYDVLFAVNTVSKTLQSSDMQLDVALAQLDGLIDFIEKYRDNGFVSAKVAATDIALGMDIEPVLKSARRIKRKQDIYQNEYIPDAEQVYVTDYFLVIVDQALTALRTRFTEMQKFGQTFGFVFDVKKLRDMEEGELRRRCAGLSDALNTTEYQDVNTQDLFQELRILREMIPKEADTALKTLRFLKRIEGTFPNCEVALRLVLTVPVTVASGERSFSKLKLIKTYLRSTMSQDRLCRLALLSIEKDVTCRLRYDDLIAEFVAKKARKVKF